MATRAKPVPTPTPETTTYWEGCRQGELRLQRCARCSAIQFPPRRYCRACLADEVRWEPASGRGRVVSWTIVRHPVSDAFANDVPYAVALVALDEGPTMMAGIHGCEPDALAIGMRVEVEFEARSDDIHVPYFHPLKAPSDRR